MAATPIPEYLLIRPYSLPHAGNACSSGIIYFSHLPLIVVKATLMLVVSEYTYCMAGVYCEFIFSRIYDLAKLAHFLDPYVTGFAKRNTRIQFFNFKEM